jgi:two-component system chemotaxis response regulator CheY
VKQCLIVDDSSVIRKVARTLLNRMGYEVVEADCGEAALAICSRQIPSAILIDWDLPDMSGFDFLVAFNRQFPTAQSHIVYATTENDPIDISRALTTGASEFLMVPFDRTALEAKFPGVAAAA